jgi:UDP-N-acetylglucosamine:LPS N-acetylglucosamine transferase
MQLLKLQPLFSSFDVSFVSTSSTIGKDLQLPNYHHIPDANLNKKLMLGYAAFITLLILVRVRPDIVITTGAAPGFIALVLGKLLGAKTIWIDSIANAEELSLSGQKARRFADIWLTQWPDLAREDGPFYIGSVI